jgi:hypothetical protein
LKYKTKSIKIKKKIVEKRAITPRWEIKFTSKLQLCKLEKRGDEI